MSVQTAGVKPHPPVTELHVDAKGSTALSANSEGEATKGCLGSVAPVEDQEATEPAAVGYACNTVAAASTGQLTAEFGELLYIGQGATGLVYRAIFTHTFEAGVETPLPRPLSLAVKFMICNTPRQLWQRAKEALLSKLVSHPNLVRTLAMDVTLVTPNTYREWGSQHSASLDPAAVAMVSTTPQITDCPIAPATFPAAVVPAAAQTATPAILLPRSHWPLATPTAAGPSAAFQSNAAPPSAATDLCGCGDQEASHCSAPISPDPGRQLQLQLEPHPQPQPQPQPVIPPAGAVSRCCDVSGGGGGGIISSTSLPVNPAPSFTNGGELRPAPCQLKAPSQPCAPPDLRRSAGTSGTGQSLDQDAAVQGCMLAPLMTTVHGCGLHVQFGCGGDGGAVSVASPVVSTVGGAACPVGRFGSGGGGSGCTPTGTGGGDMQPVRDQRVSPGLEEALLMRASNEVEGATLSSSIRSTGVAAAAATAATVIAAAPAGAAATDAPAPNFCVLEASAEEGMMGVGAAAGSRACTASASAMSPRPPSSAVAPAVVDITPNRRLETAPPGVLSPGTARCDAGGGTSSTPSPLPVVAPAPPADGATAAASGAPLAPQLRSARTTGDGLVVPPEGRGHGGRGAGAGTADAAPTGAGAGGCPGGNGAGGGPVSFQDMLYHLDALPGRFLAKVIMEFCDSGTLLQRINAGDFVAHPDKRPPAMLSATRALLWCLREVAAGMAHLHSLNIIHGDLKPGNVLLTTQAGGPLGYVCKVSDFGLATALEASEQTITHENWGTVVYMAPESCAGRCRKASDVYSFGVLLWQMCTGERPFAGLQAGQVLLGVKTGTLTLQWPAWANKSLVKVGQACLRFEPKERPAFKGILSALTKLLARLDSKVLAMEAAGMYDVVSGGGGGGGGGLSVQSTATVGGGEGGGAGMATAVGEGDEEEGEPAVGA